MKKLSLILAIVMILASAFLVVGCCESDRNDNYPQNLETLPTFEELVAMNSYDEVLKTHKNVYHKNICTPANPDKAYLEEGVFFLGNGKVDYHMVSTTVATNTINQHLSRIGNEWYYYSTEEGMYSVLELGEESVLDYTLPDMFYNCVPMGKAYIDGDYIVHHAYAISEAMDGYAAQRKDFTYYFNKDTMLLEKATCVMYNDQHVVFESNYVEFSYDVNVDELFADKFIDKVYNAENRIDLEIVVGENEKYSLVATTDSILYAVINSSTYMMYTDPECKNIVYDLSAFEGVKSLTLYAKELTFDEEVRYTVTEEEWNALITYNNYTIEQYYGNIHLIHKYTDEALQFEDGDIILFIDDKQYSLEETEEGYVAYDCTGMNYSHNGLLSGGYVYDEFTYDETLGAYVLEVTEEVHKRWEVRFENGVPVSITYKKYDGDIETVVSRSLYTNVGTTIIDIPDYVFAQEVEDNTRHTVTEEEWNLNLNAGNFVTTMFVYTEDAVFEYTYKCTGDAVEIDENIVAFDGDKTYLLEEIDGTWYGYELYNFSFLSTLMPLGLNFSDYEYLEAYNLYMPKEKTGVEFYYLFGFEDGKISYVVLKTTMDSSDSAYYDSIYFSIDEIGTAVINVPEYIIIE